VVWRKAGISNSPGLSLDRRLLLAPPLLRDCHGGWRRGGAGWRQHLTYAQSAVMPFSSGLGTVAWLADHVGRCGMGYGFGNFGEVLGPVGLVLIAGRPTTPTGRPTLRRSGRR